MSAENQDQKDFWDGFSGVWVRQQSALDALMQPVLDGVLQRANLQSGQRVLDIGCGTGTSTLRAAQAVGRQGHVLGADISEPMLVRARSISQGIDNVAFETADVAHHPFDPGSFDQVISRFGVMFFADSVAAFRNVLKAMKPGARLTMACWSHLDVNPWFRTPMIAAKNQLGAPPRLDPDGPGPLAFRDIDRVCDILEDAGFDAVTGVAQDMLLTPPGGIDEVAAHAATIGPAARAIEYFDASQDDIDAITAAVAADFAPYMTSEGAGIPAQINFYSASAPELAAS